ncbi:MAG: V-type ATP synthase subunit D [bacterium]|nr:V-type ATP synthase subunit D [bacterium]
MILDVSPTRMELLKLRKKHAIAKRGHKLLKDKLDEFIRHMLALVKELSDLRNLIDDKFALANKYMNIAGYSSFHEAITGALMASERTLTVETSYKRLLNLRIPQFSIEMEGSMKSYGFAQTSLGLDYALDLFDEVTKDIIKLSEKEKAVQMIADEIQKTRRRVNALEYILIPNVEETIKYIKMKLDEHERNTQTQLMRVKDVVRAPKAQTSAYPGARKFSG